MKRTTIAVVVALLSSSHYSPLMEALLFPFLAGLLLSVSSTVPYKTSGCLET